MFHPKASAVSEDTRPMLANQDEPDDPPDPVQPGMRSPQSTTSFPLQTQPGYPPQPGYPATHTSTTSNTTVVIQQPQTQVVIQRPLDWSTGLCSCFDDCGVCLLGSFCPIILSCVVASNAGECCCVGICCPVALRTKIRERHNIQGTITDDCCAVRCCGLCAMCQMAREVNLRGM